MEFFKGEEEGGIGLNGEFGYIWKVLGGEFYIKFVFIIVIVKFFKNVGDCCGNLIVVLGFSEFVVGGRDLLKRDGVGDVVIGWVGSVSRVFIVVNIVFNKILVVER